MTGYYVGIVFYLGITVLIFNELHSNCPFIIHNRIKLITCMIIALFWPCSIAATIVLGVGVLFHEIWKYMKKHYEEIKRDMGY